MKRSVEEALNEAQQRIMRHDFVRAILTGKRKTRSPNYLRIDLRPVEIKGHVMIQSISHDGKKDITANHALDSEEIRAMLHSGFANVIVDLISESFQVQITKKDEAITGISKTKLERVLDHDRQKERLLPESDPIFRALGMADSTGRIKPTMRDKYVQIDQLLRILEPALASFERGSKVRIVDLASGSGALTLAVHTYIGHRYQVHTTGIERNPELVEKSEVMARKAGLDGIEFQASEISLVLASSHVKGKEPSEVDLVLALHACDTATDDAIEFVIASHAKVALIVPCCHQSRGERVEEMARRFPFFGQDGIVDERILDLATDALRGQRLREAGYAVDIVEFVGDEHTARNLLIRGQQISKS